MTDAPRYHPGLFWLSLLTTVIAFILIGSGGAVTSTGMGMVDPGWSIPVQLLMQSLEKSLEQIGLFIEHSHRLLATLVGLLSIALAWICYRHEVGQRKWLGLYAFLAIAFQGGLGAARILFDPNRGIVNPFLGRDYAMIHGFCGQAAFALLAAITLAFSRSWVQQSRQASAHAASFYGLSMLVSVLFLVQLTIAVLVRHTGGDLLLIAHASVAGLILALTLAMVVKVRPIPCSLVRRPVWALVALVAMMIVLGISAWWFGAGYGALEGNTPNHHRVALATAHQWLGALTLATSVIATLRTKHHLLPTETSAFAPEAAG
jgi:heme a synthase